MTLWKLSLYNITSKPLYTLLGIISLSLSIVLLLSIQQFRKSFEHQLDTNLGTIDVVVGAKGSPLQLVLASVLHLDNPTGNISYTEAQKLSKHPMIQAAVPISYGDNYKGYRIVGTTKEFMTLYGASLATGHQVAQALEVVIGSEVAAAQQLQLGDTLISAHGLVEDAIEQHQEAYTVVGILKPTKTVIDHLIVTTLESIWQVHGHGEHQAHSSQDASHTEAHSSHDHTSLHHTTEELDQEITSLLITFRNPRALLTFPRRVNAQTSMQAVLPKYELNKLYSYLNIGIDAILIITYLILLISGITIFISLYKMVKERSYDLALLRTFGGTNFQLIQILLYEGCIIMVIAFVIGILLLHGGSYVVSYYLMTYNRMFLIVPLSFQEVLQTFLIVLGIIVVAVALSMFPMLRMNISTTLKNEK